MTDAEFFESLNKSPEQMRNSKIDAAFNAFLDELRHSILNEEVEMEFQSVEDMGNCWAQITVKLAASLTIDIWLTDKYAVYGIHSAWFDKLFDKEEDFKALKELTQKHVQPLTDADKQRIKDLQDEIDTIRNKHIK